VRRRSIQYSPLQAFKEVSEEGKEKMGSLAEKYNVCLVGSGGVGTVAAIVLEKSGRTNVTAVLRSKFEVIKERGWDVDSVDHGAIKGWRPSRGL
jgi:tRNA A37 threonylcarbamoyladenosine dehydratase